MRTDLWCHNTIVHSKYSQFLVNKQTNITFIKRTDTVIIINRRTNIIDILKYYNTPTPRDTPKIFHSIARSFALKLIEP